MLSGVHTGMSPAPSSTIPRHTTSTPGYVQVHHPPQSYPDILPVYLDMYRYITLLTIPPPFPGILFAPTSLSIHKHTSSLFTNHTGIILWNILMLKAKYIPIKVHNSILWRLCRHPSFTLAFYPLLCIFRSICFRLIFFFMNIKDSILAFTFLRFLEKKMWHELCCQCRRLTW